MSEAAALAYLDLLRNPPVLQLGLFDGVHLYGRTGVSHFSAFSVKSICSSSMVAIRDVLV